MTWNDRSEIEVEGTVTRRSSRRVLVANAIKVIGAGALVATGALGPASVAAQDDGLGAGGRTGGDSADSGEGSSLPAAGEQGLGAGGRQGGGDASGAGGVGAGGRTDAPMVMEMPDTGVGIEANAVAPILLAAGAVGAAALALRTREASSSSSA